MVRSFVDWNGGCRRCPSPPLPPINRGGCSLSRSSRNLVAASRAFLPIFDGTYLPALRAATSFLGAAISYPLWRITVRAGAGVKDSGPHLFLRIAAVDLGYSAALQVLAAKPICRSFHTRAAFCPAQMLYTHPVRPPSCSDRMTARCSAYCAGLLRSFALSHAKYHVSESFPPLGLG